MSQSLWQILVPRQFNDGRPVRTRYHRIWDEKVMDVSGGLSIITPILGKWRGPDSTVYHEGMIPVQISCSRDEIEKIIQITLDHYEQESVLVTQVSPVAIFTEATPQQKEQWRTKNKIGLYKDA